MKKYALLLIAVLGTIFCASASAETQRGAGSFFEEHSEEIKDYIVLKYTLATMSTDCDTNKSNEKQGYEEMNSLYGDKSIGEFDYSEFCNSMTEKSWKDTKEKFTDKLHKNLSESNFLSGYKDILKGADLGNYDTVNRKEAFQKAQYAINGAIFEYSYQQGMKADKTLVYILAATSAILAIIIAVLTFIVKHLTSLRKLCEEKRQGAKPTETSQSSTDKTNKPTKESQQTHYKRAHNGSEDNDEKRENTTNNDEDGSDNNHNGRHGRQDDKGHETQNRQDTTTTTTQHTTVYATESDSGLREDEKDYAHYEIRTFEDQRKGKFRILEEKESSILKCMDMHKPFCNILSKKGNKHIKTIKEGTVQLSNDNVWIVENKAEIELTD